MEIDVAKSNDLMRPLLEKWGVKLGSNVQVVLKFEPGGFAMVTIEKYLSQSEADDLSAALGDYHLVKIADPVKS